MPRFSGLLLLIVGLFLSSLSALAAGRASFPLGTVDYGLSEANLEVSRTSVHQTSIALRNPEIVREEKVVDYQTYQVFGIPGEPTLYGEGTPSLPQVTRFYRIPETGGVDLVVTNSDFELMDNVNAYPVQLEEGNQFSGLQKNNDVYNRDAWYPENVVRMSEPMLLRDFRVVSVTLCPMQYNPVTHQARVYHNLSADLVADDQPSVNELITPRRPSGAWAGIYRDVISNLDDHALDDMTTTPGTYMIMCKSDAAINGFVDSLVQWKTRSGYKVMLNRSNWASSQVMVNAIQAAYASSNPPLEFVCLIGSPAAGFGVPTASGDYDHAFALGNSGDDLEDIGVGRLTARSSGDMGTINAKIMNYERNPHMETSGGAADTNWFHKAYFLAGTGNQVASNFTLMQWGRQQFQRFTAVDSIEVGTINGTPIVNTTAQRFASGISMFLWRGTWISDVTGHEALAASCDPGWRLPITLCITCTAGDFTNGTVGMAENFLNAGTAASPKGGVSGLGSTTAGTHNPENITFTGGFIRYLASLHIEHLGNAVNGAKIQLYLTYINNFGSFANLFSRYNNLFGDPSLSVWTDVPKVLNVTHPTVLNVGAHSVAVTVHREADDAPVAGALVCLWKHAPDSTWVVGNTDANGQLELPVVVNTAGDMYLTITNRNCKPYLYTIPCSPGNWMPMLCSYTLDDDNSGGTQGNGNSIANPGETIDLPIYVKNYGASVTVNDLRAHMSSSNPRVTVLSDSISYPSLAPGDSALGVSAFRVHIAPDMQNGETALLSLNIASSSGTTRGALQIMCQAGATNYLSHQFTNGSFDPGLTRTMTVTIRNSGLVPMTGVTGHIISQSPFVQVDVADATYGDIAVNGTSVNSASTFTMSANSMAFRGHQAPMLLILTTSTGFVDSVRFTVSVGTAGTTDPTGPDSYGYYAYDNTDVSYETHPTFAYQNISTAGIGTNLNIHDNGIKILIDSVYSKVRPLPFRFKFYGQIYDTVTICSNGWIAFGNQGWNDNFRNYPIPAQQAPDAMIAPYWDDLITQGTNLGVWYYSEPDSGRFTVQWKATGTGNPPGNLDFEVTLFDTSRYPTLDGNGKILVQYNHATMNLNNPSNNEIGGCTIGIQPPGGLTGLSYAYITEYNPGAAPVQDGRAIMFTTDARMLFGNIQGVIYNLANEQPLAGAQVTIDGYGYHATTDAVGHYLLHNVLIGTYTVRSTMRRFNTVSQSAVLVSLDSTTVVDLHMPHPEMQLSTPAIFDTIGSTPEQTSFNLTNNGNGALDYSIQVFYAGDENADPWDSVGSIDISHTTDDYHIQGCEFAFDQWWVTGGGGSDGINRIYRYNLNGDLIGSIPQPTTSAMGWFDLAFDGHYLWGSDSHKIYAIDTTGQIRDSVLSPLNPSRGIAYDPTLEHFWVADYGQDIYELDRNGNIYRHIDNRGSSALSITGLAWNPTDPNGYSLYAFSQDGVNSATRVTRFNLNTGLGEFVADLHTRAGESAGGCTITPGWNSVLLVFGGILQGSAGDRLGIYEMDFNTTWIGVSPMTATVQGGSTTPITLSFNPASLRDATYRVNLHLTSVVFDTTMILPVSLTVDRSTAVGDRPSETLIPKTYALYQNYPNPFNPETQIRFDLPATSRVRLAIYNSIGQKVATLVDGIQPAGTHLVQWAGQTDSGLPAATGLYFYRLEAGSMTDVKKMLLMH